MNTLSLRRSGLTLCGQALLAGLVLLFAVPAFADEPNAAQFAALGVVMMIGFAVFAAFYIYAALTLQAIAKRTNTENGWLAWIPIANVILMLNIAKRPIWWIILCFVPLVNLAILIIVWMDIAVACKKPNWWGVLTIVPVANLVIMGLLAWGD
jgi:hypothetical protein